MGEKHESTHLGFEFLEKGTWSFENQLEVLVDRKTNTNIVDRCSSRTFMNKTNALKILCMRDLLQNFSKKQRRKSNLKCKMMIIGHEELEAF